jgi:ribosomal protein S18 acetylase RimI-like enzyme
MIRIKKANECDAEKLAHLGKVTYIESHGHFIDDKNDLSEYRNQAFSIYKIERELSNSENLYCIIYSNELPVGYAKLVLNAKHESVVSQRSCCLERIYILSEYIPLRIGQKLLNFIEGKAKELKFDTIWLCVYIKNDRAIRFYQKNDFIKSGTLDFLVNRINYENTVFKKKID